MVLSWHAPFPLLGFAAGLHVSRTACAAMMPKSTNAHQWNHGGATVACLFRKLVGGLLAAGGGWQVSHGCGPGVLAEVPLRCLFVA